MKTRWRMFGSLLACLILVTGLFSPSWAGRTASSSLDKAAAATGGLPLRLAGGTFDPVFAPESVTAPGVPFVEAYPGDGTGYYIVQFDGPIATSAVDNLKAAGVAVFDYIPDYAFIVKMNDAGRAVVEAMKPVRWVGVYQPAYRLSPDLMAYSVTEPEAVASRPTSGGKTGGAGSKPDTGPLSLVVSVFRGEPLAPIRARITAAGGTILDESQTSWKSKLQITLPVSALADVAAITGVRWIEAAPQWQLHNDAADNVMGVREVWDTEGLYGAGQTVAVCDTGLDQGATSPASLHDDFENGSGASRVTAIYDRVGDGANDVNSGHGTHVAGSVLGNGDLSGATPATHTYPESARMGAAPEANLIFQAVENNTNGALSGIPLDLNTLFAQADGAGADLHTNSWGSDVSGRYTSSSEDVDEYMWNHKDFLIFFSAGNAGIDSNADGIVDFYSMGSPATAKNSVAVGASENDRSGIANTWGSMWPSDFPANPVHDDKSADDIAGLAAFSSRGPALDGRIKPDVVAPGSWIASTKSSASSSTGWGAIDSNYMYMGGTSMSTPLTAGAAALIRQFYTDRESITPSAALIKATMVNGATDMYPGQYGTGGTQEIPATRPTNVAGWGRVNVQNAIFPTGVRTMTFVDQTTGLTTGSSDVFSYTITGSSEPFKVTLAWSDYPGSPVAAGGLVNDLDLTVTGPTGAISYPNNANQRGASQEIYYDNGFGANYWTWNSGTRAAVRFTPAQYPANLQTGLFYIASFSYPKTFTWYVYAGSDSGPTSVLATGTSTIRTDGWHAIDFSGAGVTINSGDFFLAIEMPDTDLAWFYDNTSPNSRSWDYNGSTWSANTTEDYLFHAIVSAPDAMTQQDRVNNLVGIDIPNPATGIYTVTVSGFNVPQGPQPYALVLSGQVEVVNTPPIISGIPDLNLETGESRDNAIDLWAYTSDTVDPDSALTFSITNSPPISAGVSLDADRYIDINPTPGYAGTVPVEVQVTDTGGLTDTDTFDVIFAPNTAPVLDGIPDQNLSAGESKDNAVDLWAYASDSVDSDADLTFSIANTPPVAAGVSLDANRYIDLNPTSGYTGTFPVAVEVMDTGGLTNTDTFQVTFAETQYVYLPMVVRCYPLAPSLLPISNADGDGRYTIQWTMTSCSGTASQYEFQIDDNPQFSSPDGDTTTGTSIAAYTPSPDTYFWRVRASVGGQWTDWSNVRSVTVGSFSYVSVDNDTGSTLTLEIIGIEKKAFGAGFFDFWRSVPVGTYTVKATASCGSLTEPVSFPLGEYTLRYYCATSASTLMASTGPGAALPEEADFTLER